MKKVDPFGWRTIPQVMLIAFFCLTAPQQLRAQGVQGVLDNPQPHSVQSGIGLINGWVCDAELEQRTFTINIQENVPLTFRELTRVLFNDVEILEIEVVCGDGEVAPSEACDGNNLGGQTCQSQGFDGETLSCGPSCGLDTSGCRVIG